MKVKLSAISRGRPLRKIPRMMAEDASFKDESNNSTFESRDRSPEDECTISFTSTSPVQSAESKQSEDSVEVEVISDQTCVDESQLIEDLDPSADVSPPDLNLLAHFADDGLSSAEESLYESRQEVPGVSTNAAIDGSCTPTDPRSTPTSTHDAYSSETMQEETEIPDQSLPDLPELPASFSKFPILARQLLAPLGSNLRSSSPSSSRTWPTNATAVACTSTTMTVTTTSVRNRDSPKLSDANPSMTFQASYLPNNGYPVGGQHSSYGVAPSLSDSFYLPQYDDRSNVGTGMEEADGGCIGLQAKLPAYFQAGHETVSKLLHGSSSDDASQLPADSSGFLGSPTGQCREFPLECQTSAVCPPTRPGDWTVAAVENRMCTGLSGETSLNVPLQPASARPELIATSSELPGRMTSHPTQQYSFSTGSIGSNAENPTYLECHAAGSYPRLMEHLISPSLQSRTIPTNYASSVTSDSNMPWVNWQHLSPGRQNLNPSYPFSDGSRAHALKDDHHSRFYIQPSGSSFPRANVMSGMPSVNAGPPPFLSYTSMVQPHMTVTPVSEMSCYPVASSVKCVANFHEDPSRSDVCDTAVRPISSTMTSSTNSDLISCLPLTSHVPLNCGPPAVGHGANYVPPRNLKCSIQNAGVFSTWCPQSTSYSLCPSSGHSQLPSGGGILAGNSSTNLCYQAPQPLPDSRKKRYVTVRQMLENAKQCGLRQSSSACWQSDSSSNLAKKSVVLSVDSGILPVSSNCHTTVPTTSASVQHFTTAGTCPTVVTFPSIMAAPATMLTSHPTLFQRLKSPPPYAATARFNVAETASYRMKVSAYPDVVPVYVLQNPRMSMLGTNFQRNIPLLRAPDRSSVVSSETAAVLRANLMRANLASNPRMLHWLKSDELRTVGTNFVQEKQIKNLAGNAMPNSYQSPFEDTSLTGFPSAYKCVTPQVFQPDISSDDAVIQGNLDCRSAQHYDMESLQIGTFIVKQDLAARKNISKLKIFFSKRKFVYEFYVTDVPLPGHDLKASHIAYVDVPFSIVTAVHCNERQVVIAVGAPPQLYLNFKPNRIGVAEHCFNCSRTRPTDITSGQLAKFPVHKITLKRRQAENLRSHLETFDPKLKVWFSIPIFEPVIEFPEQLLSSYGSLKRDGVYSEGQEPSAKKHCILEVASSTQNQCTYESFNDRIFCHCQVSCRSNRCSCMKSKSKCGMGPSGCLCKDCNNPLNLLHAMGMHLEDVIKDPCLIQGIVSYKGDVTNLLERQLIFPCCGESAPLKECIPGKITCPNRSCMRHQIYKLSWCQLLLMDEEQSPRNHCSACRACKDSLDLHCQACRRCNPVEGNSAKCTFCGAPRDTSFTEQKGVGEVLKRYRDQQQQRSYSSSPSHGVEKDQDATATLESDEGKTGEQQEAQKHEEEEVEKEEASCAVQKPNSNVCLEEVVTEENVVTQSNVELFYSPEVHLDENA